MDAFTKQFGTYDKASGTYELNSVWLSLFNSLNYIGFVVGEWHFRQISWGSSNIRFVSAAGVIVGSFISARFGRRKCMFVMSVYALITATIAVTSNTKDQIMVARILNYVYVGIELSVVPVFQSEIGEQ